MNNELLVVDPNNTYLPEHGAEEFYYTPAAIISNQIPERRYYYLQMNISEKDHLFPSIKRINPSYDLTEIHDPVVLMDQPFPQIAFVRETKKWIWPDVYFANRETFMISDRLKEIFERVDPGGFVYLKVEGDYSSFPQKGPQYWLTHIARVKWDCVDEERSVIGYYKSCLPRKAYGDLYDVRMKSEIVGSAHAFHLKRAPHDRIIDDILRDAINIKGMIHQFDFRPIQKS